MIAQDFNIKIDENIMAAIGNTPLVRLKNLFAESKFNVFGKLETTNPSGSVKDRTARYILQKAIDSGKLKSGDTIIESSSGNMALGLAQACIFHGLKLIVVVDPKLNMHTKKILRAYGARIESVHLPKEHGGYLAARLARVKELLCEIPNSFWTDQYGNPDNPIAHYSTMNEILDALEGKVDYLFMATSTCGSIMGCADYVQQHGIATKIVAVDAVGSVLFGGKAKDRLIPGHGAGVSSQFLDRTKIWNHVEVSDLDCVKGCWSLLKKEAILCGGSTGGVVSAIKNYGENIPENSNCVLLLCDRGERYLDTIYNQKWLSKKIKGAEAYKELLAW